MAHDDLIVIDLVARAGDGDGDAWVELVNRFAPLVFTICRQHFRLPPAECEDVAQGVWLELIRALPRLRAPAALPGWLATTTRHECLRHLEGVRRRRRREFSVEVEPPEDELTGPEQRAVAAELEAALRVAFSDLAESCQRLLVLLMQNPRPSYAEIAALLHMPIGSIGPTRGRCLGQLRRSPALAALIEAQSEHATRAREEGG